MVPAAGRGDRFASTAASGPKQYATLLGSTVLEWSLASLLGEPRVAGIIVALAADDLRWPGIAGALDAARLQTVLGGSSRQESVVNALRTLQGAADDQDWVLVHDAARPCLTAGELAALIDAVCGQSDCDDRGAVLAAPIVDTVKRGGDGVIEATVDREGLWRALTPQVFRFGPLLQALEETIHLGIPVTDEAQAMERVGVAATLVQGSPFNIKVTTPKDLLMAEQILRGRMGNRMRVGQGFDVHAFGDGDHVVLGGVRIAHSRGVEAHSDGDVVIHALCDAVLGALGAGDIGRHFPDTDPRYRGADSRLFLREVTARMRLAGLILVNADITVLAETPRIVKYRDAIAQNLAEDLGVAVGVINVKATTTERLGFIGRGEGLAASAAVLLDAG
ncbi:MAG: bifunctional 2-C-methyl-D-erythritol 4-phosphate cytidylyltransferase/2-C-methyl-D-erythritol 2,4-cyclodiphosphate synthase [Steroidobacteraceae bacterium]